MIKEYLAYLKDNPNRLWFKRKLYGWGWVPVRWQGWLVIILYILAVVLSTRYVILLARAENDDMPPPFKFIPILFFTAILMAICYAKGEKPRWQWGQKDENEKE